MERNALLNELTSSLEGEEKVVAQLAEYYSALGWKKAVFPEDRQKIEAGLTVLKTDSEKHAQIIKDIIAYVKFKGDINEF